MFFENTRADRQKRARKTNSDIVRAIRMNSPIPAAKSYELLTAAELYGPQRTLVFDIELYKNYFMIGFRCHETGKVAYFEEGFGRWIDRQLLSYIIHKHKLVSFNGIGYDIPMLQAALMGLNIEKLYEINCEIIFQNARPYDLVKRYGLSEIHINHIDVMNVAPLDGSLKLYSGRLHCERMQDLPFEPNSMLTEEQSWIVRDYNVNDLDNTDLLYTHLLPNIQLRENFGGMYGMDWRSKSDAQLAEAVIGAELKNLGIFAKKVPVEVGKTFQYKVPDNIVFKTNACNRILDAFRNSIFEIDINGRAVAPTNLKGLSVKIGKNSYNFGNGGLHSEEKNVTHVSDDATVLIDRDVTSFYPYIIINQNLYPAHLGPKFVEVFKTILRRRLMAKSRIKAKDYRDDEERISLEVTNDGLKITVNGSFGKLGNKYSDFYSPELVTQITVSGQLYILMFIEMMELAGFEVISGNTDGIVIKVPYSRMEEYQTVVSKWEDITNFETEETRYKALLCRDVNNYIAIKYKETANGWSDEIDTKCKLKGVYSEKGSAQNSVLSKNPETLILSDAVQAFLLHGTPLERSIRECQDMRRFVAVRTVKGGAEDAGTYLGRAIRWYYSADRSGALHYVNSGNTVPKSEGACPCMILPAGIPDDLDYDWYIHEARETLFDIGFYERPREINLFS